MFEGQQTKLRLSRMFAECYSEREGIPEFKLFIGGKWVQSAGGGTSDVDSPIDDRVIARVQAATIADVEGAVGAAYRARRSIRDIPAIDRIEVLNRARHVIEDHREDFVNTLVAEAGKPVNSAVGEVSASLSRIKMTMEEARSIFGAYVPGDWSEDTMAKFALVIHEPLGVIACISPFNYPLFSVIAKVVPAIVSGNTVVVKPASDDPVVALLLGRALQEAGVPDGVVNVITGSGKQVGDALVSHEHVSMVTLTGSTEVGKHVAGLVGMKKRHLELGGKGAAIVAADADLPLAAEKVLEGCLKYSGQRCDAISRVFVEEKVADQLMGLLIKDLDTWKVGDPRDTSNSMGPLINPMAAERVQSLVDDAVSKGGLLMKGGKHSQSYFEPTVLDRVPLEARIASEETFGPVVTVVRVKSIEEAIERTNESRYGLDSCVFTNSLYTAWRVAKALEEGTVSINDAPAHGVGYFPFGGNKDSGIGREGVGYSIDEMTRIKTIQFNLAPAGLGKTRQTPKM
ncbi:MAG: aldehyde dehydrogenase family protein [Nitrososphaerales archaeon]|jgi:glyceraldehyde-3-phosphate dehydrogenase [NAD(P)+]